MREDREGFLYPSVDKTLCTDCGLCKKVCPVLNQHEFHKFSVAYAAKNKNEQVRAESSSGGMFTLLAEQTIAQGGAVFGAKFNDKLEVVHDIAESVADLKAFRGSKYVQSRIGDTYRHAANFLRQERQVLFSGTPCQIAGLYAFLGKDDVNLLTCDVVCHGVPSPKVLAAYLSVMESRHGAKVQRISFRCKDCGWKRYSVALSFDNATEYRRIFAEDPFMIGFLRNTYLRPSCHSCRFSRLPRIADITLGDFWGVGGYHPEWDDDKGLSLVLVQSEKGQKAIDVCRDCLVMHCADLDVAIKSNPCICGFVPPGKDRTVFFRDLNRTPFDKMMRKYMSPTPLWTVLAINLPKRIIRYGLRILKSQNKYISVLIP